jgi:hypothetical protein
MSTSRTNTSAIMKSSASQGVRTPVRLNEAAITYLFQSNLSNIQSQERLQKALFHISLKPEGDAFTPSAFLSSMNIMELLPQKDRISFVKKCAKSPLTINKVWRMLTLLPDSAKAACLNAIVMVNNIGNEYPSFSLAKILNMLKEKERTDIADKYADLIIDEDDFKTVILTLPPLDRNSYAHRHADKIKTREGLITVLTKNKMIDSITLTELAINRVVIDHIFILRAMRFLEPNQRTEFLLFYHIHIHHRHELMSIMTDIPLKNKPEVLLFFSTRKDHSIALPADHQSLLNANQPIVIFETESRRIEDKSLLYAVESITYESPSKLIIQVINFQDAINITKFLNQANSYNRLGIISKAPKFTVSPMDNWQRKLVLEGNLVLGVGYLKIRFISDTTYQKLAAEWKKLTVNNSVASNPTMLSRPSMRIYNHK